MGGIKCYDMISLFRRVRKGILSEGAASKYLLYAIGEIALVVIGILIALQVNNWNNNKINKELKNELLIALSKDLEDDKELLQRRIIWDSIRLLGAQILHDTMNNQSVEIDIQALNGMADQIQSSFKRAFENRIQSLEVLRYNYLRRDLSFSAQKATFLSLSQGDNLTKLKNIELQNSISSYYTLVDYVNMSENYIRDHETIQYVTLFAEDPLLSSDLTYFLSKKKEIIGVIELVKEMAGTQLNLYKQLMTKLVLLKENVEAEIE